MPAVKSLILGANGLPYEMQTGDYSDIVNGGTGATTATGAFANLSPMTTAGDMIRQNVSGAERLPLPGFVRRVMMTFPYVGQTLPDWATVGDALGIQNREMWLLDDFFSPWTPVATSGGTQTYNTTLSDDSKHGLINLNSGANAAGVIAWHNGLANFKYANPGVLNNGAIIIDTILKLSATPTAGADYGFTFGFQNTTTTGEPTNGMYIKVLRATSTTNWVITTSSGGVRTNSVTSVALSTAYTRLRVILDPANSLISFAINSTTVGTINTNIPLTALGLMYKLWNLSANTKTVSIDNIYVWHYCNSLRQ